MQVKDLDPGIIRCIYGESIEEDVLNSEVNLQSLKTFLKIAFKNLCQSKINGGVRSSIGYVVSTDLPSRVKLNSLYSGMQLTNQDYVEYKIAGTYISLTKDQVSSLCTEVADHTRKYESILINFIKELDFCDSIESVTELFTSEMSNLG